MKSQLTQRALDSLLVAALNHSAADVAELLEAGANPNQVLTSKVPGFKFPFYLTTALAHDYMNGKANEEVVSLIFSKANIQPFDTNPDTYAHYRSPLGAIFLKDMDDEVLDYKNRANYLFSTLSKAGYKLDDYSVPKSNVIALIFSQMCNSLYNNSDDLIDTSEIKFSLIQSAYDTHTLKFMINQTADFTNLSHQIPTVFQNTILGHLASGFNNDEFMDNAFPIATNILQQLIEMGADIYAPMASGKPIIDEVSDSEIKTLMLDCYSDYLSYEASSKVAHGNIKQSSMRRM